MNAHPSTAVLQQYVDVLLILKMVIKLHYVPVVEGSVQLDLFVNLQKKITQALAP